MEEATKSSTPPELAKLLPEPSSSGSEENTQATATSTQPSQVSTNVTSSASASTTQGSETGSATSKEPRGEDTEEGGDLLSNLSHYFYQKLGFDTDEEAVHVLEEPTLDGIVRYIHGKKCKNVIAMIGAGISTALVLPILEFCCSVFPNLAPEHHPIEHCTSSVQSARTRFNINVK
ncbi:NAD-dependent protein deacetylase sirtuin-2 [Ixodes scapularis]